MSEFTGEMLREARVRKGLSQDEAANLMNVAKRAISEMEAGKRSISAGELAQFSRIYNLSSIEIPVHDEATQKEMDKHAENILSAMEESYKQIKICEDEMNALFR